MFRRLMNGMCQCGDIARYRRYPLSRPWKCQQIVFPTPPHTGTGGTCGLYVIPGTGPWLKKMTRLFNKTGHFVNLARLRVPKSAKSLPSLICQPTCQVKKVKQSQLLLPNKLYRFQINTVHIKPLISLPIVVVTTAMKEQIIGYPIPALLEMESWVEVT